MTRLPILLFALLLATRAGFATVIMIVGTKDGLLVCEDRRLTSRSSNGQISFTEAEKAQQIGKFGLFAVAGDISGRVTNFFGQSITTYDVLAEVPSFFLSRDIQHFDEPMALELEANLRDQLSHKQLVQIRGTQTPQAQTEVLLYWMDQTGQAHLYVVDIASALDLGMTTSKAPSPPRLVGTFIPLAAFRTSRPIVRGRGLLGYDAIAKDTGARFDDLRQDEELKPFLTDFVDAASVDSIAASRALKKLIKAISDRQGLISATGLDVGPVSDCFLGTQDGIKNINQ